MGNKSIKVGIKAKEKMFQSNPKMKLLTLCGSYLVHAWSNTSMCTRIVNAAAITSVLWAGALASAAHAQACQWLVSDGGTSNFRKLAVGPPLAGLRFGDFNGDGVTDVFATVPRSDGSGSQ
ncbi:MAG: FG-GAP repeat protein, partial [Nostoc sp.]|uniref:FG-GAP repeat protein n=1 Tax=Nostoc sp. TaxID=1180 RepID=UPI002FF913B8